MTDPLQQRTIDDFGEQWTRYSENRGFYASVDLLRDVFGPLLDVEQFAGCRVAEIGAGTGRFVRVLVDAGASSVLAIEPSAAMEILKRNTRDLNGVEYLQASGDRVPPTADFDFVLSIGVLHHVPNPNPIVDAAWRALRPGGTIAIWLYGRESNWLLLGVLSAVLGITRRLPHRLLAAFVWFIYWPVAGYMHACRLLPLPMSAYMRDVFLRFDRPTRRLVLYDQLNPAYAKYYVEAEARSLLERAGFADVKIYHRHGYSWSVTGRRPLEP
jgi:SAM-dependent methyltransferase